MEPINLATIQQHIDAHLSNGIQISQDAFGVYTCELDIKQLYQFVHFLYKDEVLAINFLTDICGVHYPDQTAKEIGVVYHLQSMKHQLRLRVKVFVSESRPEVPSLTGIYGSANWMERETYDFYGVQFLGHPNLKRILNMDEMVAFPMRKEFPLEDPNREDKIDYQFGR
ncbi:MAG: NADH-quinone oxidoreductase subunit C [Saprospiraceae bacterium]